MGQCTDFNLMLRKGQCQGRLQAFRADRNEQEITLQEGTQTAFLYCAAGSLRIRTDTWDITVGEKECLRLEDIPSRSVRISADPAADCITAEIRKTK